MTEITIQKNNSNSDKLWWKPMLALQKELNENLKEIMPLLNPTIANFWKFEDKTLRQIQKDTHRVFSELFNNRHMLTPWFTGNQTEPYVNIIENGTKYKLQADVPGLSAKELNVLSEDNSITIKGSHSESKVEDNDRFIRKECHSGSFSRTIALPDDADTSKAKASFEQNVLIIEIPKKAESAKPSKDTGKTSIPISQKNKQKAA